MIVFLIVAVAARLGVGLLSGELSNVAATAGSAPEASLVYAIAGTFAVVAMAVKPALVGPIQLAGGVFLLWDTWRIATALGVIN